MQEVTKNLQLVVNSMAVGSQGASRHHFCKDCRSTVKYGKVTETNPGETAKAKGEEWEGRNELYSINCRANWH